MYRCYFLNVHVHVYLYLLFIELPVPIEVIAFCSGLELVTVWNPPHGRIDMYTGYDVRHSNPKAGEVIYNNDEDQFFHAIIPDVKVLGLPHQVFTQVGMISANFVGPDGYN